MSRNHPCRRPNLSPELRFCSRSLLVALVVASAMACGGDSTGVDGPTISTPSLAAGVVQTALDAGQAGGRVEFAAGAYVIGGDGLVNRTPGVALIRHHADELHGHGSFFV